MEYRDECHWMLLGLAGRAPDALLTQCRTWLAQDDGGALGQALTQAAASGQVSLSDNDVDLVTELMIEAGLDIGALEDVPTAGDAGLRHGFAATPTGAPPRSAKAAERAAVSTARAAPAARAVWRAWRTADDSSERAVFVVETDLEGDLPAITAVMQSALANVGERDPQVETYPVRSDLPRYQRLARGSGALLWTREPAPEVRMAALFDGVDAESGPFMRPEHPTVDDDAERADLVRYLSGGRPLLVTTALMDDVVDSTRGHRVPMSFRTDGAWIWTDAITYYLAEHRLRPDPELTAHIRANDFRVPDVDGAGMHRAMAKLTEPTESAPAWTYR